LRLVRRRLQLIFQDPIASLDPRRHIGDIVAEPLVIAGVARPERQRRVRGVLAAVGLDPDQTMGRLAHEFSGGQCQRISIARALVLEPRLLICDEPVSALDVLVRAQILNLLEAMKARYGLTLLFIAHDLAVVKAVSDRVAVMYLGKIVEVGETEALFRARAHPIRPCCCRRSPFPIRRSSRPRTCPSANRPRSRRHPAAASARTARARRSHNCASLPRGGSRRAITR
jgi:peptide/nickel transport system ATP-binding protein